MDINKIKAHIALLVVALIYGGNYIIAKDVMAKGFLEPYGFTTMRAITGAILFYLVSKLLIKQKVDKKDIPYLALCGLFGVAVNMLCFFIGLSMTSPINASLIMISTPILVLILSAIFLSEKITKRKLLGITLGVAGAILLISQRESSKAASIQGDLLVMVNAFSYGTYLILVKKMLKKYNPFLVLSWVFLFGALYVTPLGFRGLASVEFSTFPSEIIWAIVFVLLLTTFTAHLLNAFALSKVNASVVSFYIYFQPLIASFLAVILQVDSLDTITIASTVLLFLGVYFVSMKTKKSPQNKMTS